MKKDNQNKLYQMEENGVKMTEIKEKAFIRIFFEFYNLLDIRNILFCINCSLCHQVFMFVYDW